MLLLGRELGWQDERLPQIIEASFLHDVGRVGVADSVLFKPGLLSDAETAELRNHPVARAEIVRPLFNEDLVLAVRHHHERWDGQGYPDGLTGEAIPELARALCIVDSYDVTSFQRPHRAALSYAECLSAIPRTAPASAPTSCCRRARKTS
jgi:HD-GYP domain-containing protein (c-di-GMP phosphodiesterase class II)